jgi:hypothetical protein
MNDRHGDGDPAPGSIHLRVEIEFLADVFRVRTKPARSGTGITVVVHEEIDHLLLPRRIGQIDRAQGRQPFSRRPWTTDSGLAVDA